jgi:peptidoglycan hydrolase FlgJ
MMSGIGSISAYAPSLPSCSGLPQGPLDASGVPLALRSSDMSKEDKLRVAGQQFESFLMATMIKEMRATVPESGLLPKGSGEQTFREMLDEKLAQNLSGRVGSGLSDALTRQLSPVSAAKKG